MVPDTLSAKGLGQRQHLDICQKALWYNMGAQRGSLIINKVGFGDSLTPAHPCEAGKLSGLLMIVTLRRRRGCEVRGTPLWNVSDLTRLRGRRRVSTELSFAGAQDTGWAAAVVL
jgi:hypothetical protein